MASTSYIKTYRKSNKRKTYDSAAEKFDALFGSSKPDFKTKKIKENEKQNPFNSPPPSLAPAAASKDQSPIKFAYFASSPKKTKYEELFEQNEKSASDKFDAIFNEGPGKVKPKPKIKSVQTTSSNNNDVFSTNTEKDTRNDDISTPACSIVQSPNKDNTNSKISHATMTKMDSGKLMLNIHRKTQNKNDIKVEKKELLNGVSNSKQSPIKKQDILGSSLVSRPRGRPNQSSSNIKLISKRRQNEKMNNLVPTIDIQKVTELHHPLSNVIYTSK